MKPTKKEATPTPAPAPAETPVAEEAAAASDKPATEAESPPVRTDGAVADDAGETASPSPVEGGEAEVDGGGEAPQADPEAKSEEEAPAAPEPVAEEAADEPQPEPAKEGATSGAWTEVKLGAVECRGKNMSVNDVLECLPPAGIDRVKILTGEHSIHIQANRLLGPDGRCTPVVFSGEDAPEHIVDGYDTIAAALVAGIDEIPVVLVEPSRVEFVQSFLGSRRMGAAAPSTQEDDLLWRVNGLAS